MEPKKKEYTHKDIVRALGAALSLFCFLVLLSPSSSLSFLAIGVFYLFGFTGFWLLLPALFLLGLSYFLLGSAPGGKGFGRYAIAFFLCYLGIALLIGRYTNPVLPSFNDFSLFHGGNADYGMGLVLNGGASHLPTMPEFGGGILVYVLLCLFEMAGSFLTPVIASVLIVLSIFVAFFPLLKKGYKAMRGRMVVQKARRQDQRERKEALKAAQKEEEDMERLYRKYLGEEGSNKKEEPTPYVQEQPVTREREPSLSRLRENALRVDNPAIPREEKIGGQRQVLSLSTQDLRDTSLKAARLSFPGSAPKGPTIASLGESQGPRVQESVIVPAQENKAAPAYSAPLPSNPAAEEPRIEEKPEVKEEAAPVFAYVPSFKKKAAPEPKVEAPVVQEVSEPEAPKAEAPLEVPQKAAPTPVSVPSGPSYVAPTFYQEEKKKELPPYRLPPEDLLKVYGPSPNAEQNEHDAAVRQSLINETFRDLGVPAEVVSYTIGPSVTRYDIQTARDSSVTSLNRYMQDVSVRLGGVPARFEQVVKGKSTSGLEIPNAVTTTVSFKEMFEALPVDDGRKNLYIPFGKSITGECLSSDLSEFPHMLVAGTTGSGKSIFIHGVIMSLLMRNTPDDLKFVLVDPKRVEMAKYKDLPHLLCPIVKEPSEARICLNKLAEEMERRYLAFEESGVRDIRQYNEDYVAETPGAKKMPFIVVVVDEFADLKMTCKDIDEVIIRLTSKARAAGIHLIIATQRPSVDIVTGPIKANLGVKVALSVNNSVNSRVILDADGAEDLIGKGDMLVDCPMMSRNGFTRLQGCFVDNKEITAVTNFIRSERPSDYDPNFLDLTDHEAEAKAVEAQAKLDRADLKALSDEEQYEQIKRNVMGRDYASVSYIQRVFSIGFPKAGRIFTRLQEEGIVATEAESPTSNKGCRVLVHMEEGQ